MIHICKILMAYKCYQAIFFLQLMNFFFYYQTNPLKFLLRAFIWSDTPEGEEYWDRIYNDWADSYKECIEIEKT